MERGLRAPLSPNEEVALRRIATGVAQPSGREIERLKQLGLVESADEALCLSETGRERYARLPDAAPPQDAASADRLA
ncbi:MAG TPA: hypothetical protein VF991_06810 [Reyranella sp.]